MITEEMRAAGWRECPTDEVRKAWEEKGERWHISWIGDGSDNIGPGSPVAWPPFHNVEDSRIGRFSMWRPVNTTTWDYCPDGWGDAIKIERWLTEDDVEKYGNLWRWWSHDWVHGTFASELAMAYIDEDGEVKICASNQSAWMDDCFGVGDYFTPARAG